MKPPFLSPGVDDHASHIVGMSEILIALGCLPKDYELDYDSLNELGRVIRDSAEEILRIVQNERGARRAAP
ncbi:hypothetical protein [Enterovirga rhinocerotis]|uniref:Uncharacterized protein n=1 Tax=Enterovirga rhinocerotis TaxID=1339210 RepID=A0A4R7C769_9HYPH|nr:hypothetical protein [Enterovirga rhinocerotis]TDR93812.1 hypothetical protein EV668_1079 [Enterovirga rhinocerotis]